jgi:hypothetical protein
MNRSDRTVRHGFRPGPAAVAVFAGVLAAPAGAQIFQKATFSPNFSEVANDVVDTRECGFSTVGTQSGGEVALITGVQLALFDPNGIYTGGKLYNFSTGQVAGYTLVESQSAVGGYILGAECSAISVLGKWILRTDATGALLWSFFYPGTAFYNAPQRVVGVSVRELNDLTIASVNRIQNFANIPFGGVLTRSQAGGLPIFTRVYDSLSVAGAPVLTDFADLRQLLTPAGGPDLVVVGNMYDPSTGLYDALAVRFDLNGNPIWAKSYARTGENVFADSVTVLPDESVYFCGRRGPYVAGQQDPTDMISARIDPLTGNVLWATEVDNFQPGYQAIRFSPTERDLVIAGTVFTAGAAATSDASMLKLTTTGLLAGAELYGSFAPATQNTGTGVTFFEPWGGYALVGATNDLAAPTNALYMVKSYTTLESGCRETAYSPVTRAVKLNASSLTLNSAAYAEYISPQPTVTPLPQTQKTACFDPRCIGDLNGDGQVDDADFVIFSAAYNALICPTDPRFTCCPSDFNGDGMVDDADFVLFTASYNALLCP